MRRREPRFNCLDGINQRLRDDTGRGACHEAFVRLQVCLGGHNSWAHT